MTKMPKAMVLSEVCGTCVHYHQHYTLMPRYGFVPLWYGHCGGPSMKSRNPDEVCENWASREA